MDIKTDNEIPMNWKDYMKRDREDFYSASAASADFAGEIEAFKFHVNQLKTKLVKLEDKLNAHRITTDVDQVLMAQAREKFMALTTITVDDINVACESVKYLAFRETMNKILLEEINYIKNKIQVIEEEIAKAKM